MVIKGNDSASVIWESWYLSGQVKFVFTRQGESWRKFLKAWPWLYLQFCRWLHTASDRRWCSCWSRNCELVLADIQALKQIHKTSVLMLRITKMSCCAMSQIDRQIDYSSFPMEWRVPYISNLAQQVPSTRLVFRENKKRVGWVDLKMNLGMAWHHCVSDVIIIACTWTFAYS